MKTIIIADGDVPASLMPLTNGGWTDALVIAADGGALKAEALGLSPAIVIGDNDSLSPAVVARLREEGAEIIDHPRAKDESDTELALREALRRGAREIMVLGALGGRRFEHSLANVLLLALPELDGIRVTLADGSTTVRVIGGPARLELRGTRGDHVSLLPLSDPVDGVSTSGLAFPLADERLHLGPSRGLSNEMLGEAASVTIRGGRLAVVHTRGESEAVHE